MFFFRDGPHPDLIRAFCLGRQLVKQSGEEPAYNLAGTLQLLGTGWVVVSVPNALVRGVFDAMAEPGIELPPGATGMAHVPVFSPEELAKLGGADRITERGRQFNYTLGRLVAMDPGADEPGIARLWAFRVHSGGPGGLQELRRSYGLPSLPGEDGDRPFRCVVALRRRGVLGRTDTAKA